MRNRCMYTLWNDYHNQVNSYVYPITSHSKLCVWVFCISVCVRTLDIYCLNKFLEYFITLFSPDNYCKHKLWGQLLPSVEGGHTIFQLLGLSEPSYSSISNYIGSSPMSNVKVIQDYPIYSRDLLPTALVLMSCTQSHSSSIYWVTSAYKAPHKTQGSSGQWLIRHPLSSKMCILSGDRGLYTNNITRQ